ncbi:MAG: conjugal transfer protein TraX [Treponema sp.]|nr:conjugal transfer protein TraX [Treponema sp.]
MKKLSLDAFTLKLIAIISMGIHHTVMILWEIFPVWVHIPLYILRGITFPIMAFFVTEGFRRTSNIKRYMLRLLVFGLIAQLPYTLAMGIYTLNIIFSILVGLICLALYEKLYVQGNKRALFVITFIAILLVSMVTIEGALFGPLMIFLYHVIKNEKRRRTIPLISWFIMMLVSNLATRAVMGMGMEEMDAILGTAGRLAQLEVLMSQYPIFSIGALLIIPLLWAYNGERGRRAKFLFYTFYPAHFAILAVIAFALGLVNFSVFGF